MKKIILLILLSNSLLAQQRLDFKMLRYEEDYSNTVEDSNATFFDKIKYIPLDKNKSSHLSIGGDVRTQYQYFKNESWGDIENDKDGFVLNRALLHADLKFKNHFRLFSQLQSSTAISRINPSPVDRNDLDIHQLFFDVNLNWDKNKVVFRLGRQEMFFGAQRLVSFREGPNSRQAFDAAKIIFENTNFKTDIFYSQNVINQFGFFDDRLNSDTKFMGFHTTFNEVPILENTDFYYFILDKKYAQFDDAQGNEKRHTVGTRIWRKNKDWNYDFEAVYQFGDIGDKKIEAWTVSVNSTYKFKNVKFKPTIGFKTELISGDKEYDDTILQTFNPLFPRGAYFGLAALIGPSNLFDIHPSIDLQLHKDVVFSIDYDFFWRFSSSDGIYQPNGMFAYSGRNTSEKYIGNQLGANITYDVKKWFTIVLEATCFNAGNHLKEISPGKDILFTATTLQVRF